MIRLVHAGSQAQPQARPGKVGGKDTQAQTKGWGKFWRDVIGPRQDTTTSPGQARHWGGEGDCSTDQGVGYGRGIKGPSRMGSIGIDLLDD